MKPIRVISSEPETWSSYLINIYQNRSLILTFAKRDLKIKYAQTTIGILWTIVQPATAVVIYSLFFYYFIKFETSYPFVLYVLSGILMWGFFNYVFSQSSTSLINNSDLVKKLNFPKILLPLSKVIVAFSEFLITMLLFLILIIFFKSDLPITIALSFLALIPVLLFALGSALILSSLTLKYRDLFHIIPFLVNFGIWFTPVFFPVSIIPERFQFILFLNPITTGIQFFRFCFFGEPLSFFMILGLLISIIFFIIGMVLFKRTEDKIIDLL